MKQIRTTPQVKCEIETLEAETKHLTLDKNTHYSKKSGYFIQLSQKWLMAYCSLNEVAIVMTNEEYKKYYEKMMYLRDKMVDFVIFGR